MFSILKVVNIQATILAQKIVSLLCCIFKSMFSVNIVFCMHLTMKFGMTRKYQVKKYNLKK